VLAKDGLALRSIGFFFFTSGFFARRRAAFRRARDPVRRDMVSPLESTLRMRPAEPHCQRAENAP